MKKIILFSQPEERVLQMLDDELFTKEMNGKIFSYMPCDGNDPKEVKYVNFWQEKVEEQNGIFQFVDNSKAKSKSNFEIDKVLRSDYLMIPGGNTFHLLRNLRRSGLFNAVLKFFQKENYVYCGMSAGAVILASSIDSVKDHGFACGFDENDIGLKNLNSFGFIDFDPIVHFDPVEDKEALKRYKSKADNEVRTITNDGYIVLKS